MTRLHMHAVEMGCAWRAEFGSLTRHTPIVPASHSRSYLPLSFESISLENDRRSSEALHLRPIQWTCQANVNVIDRATNW